MRQSYKNTLRRALVRIYAPCIYRLEKLRATLLWRSGVRSCIRKARGITPRLYMLYDSNTGRFVSLSYDMRRDTPSVRSLLRLGKMHVRRRPTVSDMMRECFYYTGSKWGAPTCDAALKLREWLAYYLAHESMPVRKLAAYRKKYGV